MVGILPMIPLILFTIFGPWKLKNIYPLCRKKIFYLLKPKMRRTQIPLVCLFPWKIQTALSNQRFLFSWRIEEKHYWRFGINFCEKEWERRVLPRWLPLVPRRKELQFLKNVWDLCLCLSILALIHIIMPSKTRVLVSAVVRVNDIIMAGSHNK